MARVVRNKRAVHGWPAVHFRGVRHHRLGEPVLLALRARRELPDSGCFLRQTASAVPVVAVVPVVVQFVSPGGVPGNVSSVERGGPGPPVIVRIGESRAPLRGIVVKPRRVLAVAVAIVAPLRVRRSAAVPTGRRK